MKYKIREYMGSFNMPDDEDEYNFEFPLDQHLTYEIDVDYQGSFNPYDVALEGLKSKYTNTPEEIEEFKSELSVFDYAPDDTDTHYLYWHVDDGENVDLITIIIQKFMDSK